MSMSQFTSSVFAAETRGCSRADEAGADRVGALPEMSTWRARRCKRTSYSNNCLTTCVPCHDEPPTYTQATKRQYVASPRFRGPEVLPQYECSVAAQGKMLLNVESINPLHIPFESDWREVYVVLKGTLLNLHRLKDGGPGKLLRSYTLQHAEVGLATDSQHTVLVPQTKLARLIPPAARRRAWQRDADLFACEKQTILRLRVETDQILLADSSEENLHSFILAICAGIDIAPALDERALPKQCTMPRRRRRPRPEANVDLSDPALLRQQAQILEERYPGLAESNLGGISEDTRPELRRTSSSDQPNDSAATPFREEDEPDLSMIREDSSLGDSPAVEMSGVPTTTTSLSSTRDSSLSTMHFTPDMVHATPASNINPSGKWQPPTPQRSPSTHQRYVRRCMPVLLAEAPRASDVLVVRGGGARVRIDWATETLEPWELAPPSYVAHHFPERTDSGLAMSTTTTSSAMGSDDDTIAAVDRISPVESDASEQVAEGLVKMASASSMLAAKAAATAAANGVAASGRGGDGRRKARQPMVRNAQELRLMAQDYQGVVFCF